MNETVFVGIFFIFMGLFFLVMNPKITFSCHRSPTKQQSCQLTRSGIMGSKTTRIPLETLQNAKLETSLDGDGDPIYKIVLLTKTGIIPLYPAWANIN